MLRSPSGEARISLVDDNDNNFSNGYDNVLFNSNVYDVATSTLTRYCVSGLNISIDPTKFYYLYNNWFTYGKSFYIGGENNSNAWDGEEFNWFYEIENNQNKDIYFELNGDEDFIQIIRPENSTTTINEAFLGNFWGVNVSANSLNCSTGSPCKIDIIYYGNETPIYDDWTALYSTSTQEKYFPKVNTLNSGIYTAKAYLFDNFTSSTLIASSSFITFTIATSTPQGVQEACSSGGWLENSLCSVFYFLFKPSQTTFESLTTIKDRIINKPPIGYFTIIKDKISNLTVGTSTYAIIDASTTEAFSGIFNPIKTGFTWFLWLFFGFFVFNRFRHFEV